MIKYIAIVISLTLLLLIAYSYINMEQNTREIVIQTNNRKQVRQILERTIIKKIEWKNIKVTNVYDHLSHLMFSDGSHLIFSLTIYLPNPSQTITIMATNISYIDLLEEICHQTNTYWCITEWGIMASNPQKENDSIAAGILITGKEWFDEYKKTHK